MHYKPNRGTGKLIASLLAGLLLAVGMVLWFAYTPPGKAVAGSSAKSSSACFSLITDTLSYVADGWLVNARLSIEDPAKVNDDTKFTVSLDPAPTVPPEILYNDIRYEPPMTLRFYFDIANSMFAVPNEDHAKEEQQFWQEVFDQVSSWLEAEERLEISSIKAYCNCDCNGISASKMPFYAEDTWISTAARNFSYEAIDCSLYDPQAGYPAQTTIIMPTYPPQDANLWVIFRWQPGDEARSERDWTRKDKEDWKKQLINRYPMISELQKNEYDRVLIMVLNRQKRNPDWNSFQEIMHKLNRVYVGYLQIQKPPQKNDIGFIRRHLTTLNINMPVRLPVLLDEDQIKNTKLKIDYPDCEPVSISLNPSHTGAAVSSSLLYIQWVVQYGTILALFIGALLLVSLSLYRYNPRWYNLRTRLENIVVFPWENPGVD